MKSLKVWRLLLIGLTIGIVITELDSLVFAQNNFSASWQTEYGFREFSITSDSDFSLVPGSQTRIKFDRLDWQDYQLTNVEAGLIWRNIILESAREDYISDIHSLGIGVSYSWNNQIPILLFASMMPRNGFFYFISGKSETNNERVGLVKSFGEIKNYSLGSVRGFKAKGKVIINHFSFCLSGFRLWKRDLLSQDIKINISYCKNISSIKSISSIFGIKINEVWKYFGNKCQHFLFQNCFGELVFQNQDSITLIGIELKDNHLIPYVKVEASLSF